MKTLPATGVYCLVIELPEPAALQVGKLGEFLFEPGFYLYTGTAQRNLPSRVARHRRKNKRFHWHIDYLLARARIREVLVAEGPKRIECLWSQHLGSLPGACQPVKGFGASDCSCHSHLTLMDDSGDIERFVQSVFAVLSGITEAKIMKADRV